MSNKKLNLLPVEIKNRYINKNLVYISVILGVVMLFILSVKYIQIGTLNYQIDKIIENNQKYNEEKENILKLEESIKIHNDFLINYGEKCFPFSIFLNDLENIRPNDVFIISVDSKERLVNEGVNEEKDKKAETKIKDDKEENKSKKETVEKSAEEDTVLKIAYTEDLSGKEIVIRGYGKTQETISDFIYDLTHLSYISDARITAIEEHLIADGVYNIFEIILTGGVI